MKDTTARGPVFSIDFQLGALARQANPDSAAHGAEMDAPVLLPAGGCENTCPCSGYSAVRQIPVER